MLFRRAEALRSHREEQQQSFAAGAE